MSKVIVNKKTENPTVDDILFCLNCKECFGNCECGEWDPFYINDSKFLKDKKTGRIWEVAEHVGHFEYLILHAKTKRECDLSKRLKRNYQDFLPSTESEYNQYINSNP